MGSELFAEGVREQAELVGFGGGDYGWDVLLVVELHEDVLFYDDPQAVVFGKLGTG